MKLLKLLKKCEILDANVDFDIDISSLASDSRKIKKNDVFVAIDGENRDGNDYIDEAMKNGAVAVVTDKIVKNSETPYVLVRSARETLSKMCSEYYGNPTKDMKVIAITGTNGKTSTAYYLYNILRKSRKSVGLISTIDCLINDERVDIGGGGAVFDIESAMTTPDPEILYMLLNKMKKKSVKYVIMEASSHAIKQKKLEGIEIIELGIFTNLSEEHLDFHKTMQDYFQTKKGLIEKAKTRLVNIDDIYGEEIHSLIMSKSYSCKKEADFSLVLERISSVGSEIIVSYMGKNIKIKSKMNSIFGIYNLGMAVSAGILLGIDQKSIIKGVENVRIKGRFEKFKENIYIDYAHTPVAIKKALEEVKSIEKEKKIIALFGCGGDRDKDKRKEMGKIASSIADLIIITSDNSRNEDPMMIIKDIMFGIDKRKPHIIIPDRKDAIKYGVKLLNKNNILVLLGKGHEEYEIDKTGKHYFSERALIDEVLRNG